MEPVRQFLVWFAECFDPPPGHLYLDSYLDGLENFDSLAQLSVLAMIDTRYNIVVEGTVLTTCKTVEELFNFVQAELK